MPMSYEVIQADLDRDREIILDLWNNHHDQRLDDKYQWLYEQNPDGRALVWLARVEGTDEYVGMTSLFPRRLLYMNGRQQSAIAGDLFICPEHRSLQAAILLQRTLLEAVDAGAVSTVYVFPNRQAALVMRRVGYKFIAPMIRMVWILKADRQLQKRGLNRILSKVVSLPIDFYLWCKSLLHVISFRKNLKYSLVKIFDERYEQLWDRCRHQFDIGLDKNAAYMNWKYVSDPYNENHIFSIFDLKKRVMFGCIVYREDKRSIEIRDIVVEDDDDICGFLIYFFLKYIRRCRAESVYAGVLENSRMKDRLLKMGFMQGSKGRDIFFYSSKSTIGDTSHMGDSRKWLLMNCDDDT